MGGLPSNGTPAVWRKALASSALITPDEAARQIVAGWRAGDFEIHFPKRFTLWLKALRHLGHGPYFAAIRRTTGL